MESPVDCPTMAPTAEPFPPAISAPELSSPQDTEITVADASHDMYELAADLHVRVREAKAIRKGLSLLLHGDPPPCTAESQHDCTGVSFSELRPITAIAMRELRNELGAIRRLVSEAIDFEHKDG